MKKGAVAPIPLLAGVFLTGRPGRICENQKSQVLTLTPHAGFTTRTGNIRKSRSPSCRQAQPVTTAVPDTALVSGPVIVAPAISHMSVSPPFLAVLESID